MYKQYCRIVQTGLKVFLNSIKWRYPHVIKGCGTLSHAADIIKNNGIKSILLIASGTVMKAGLLDPLFDALTKSEINFAVYNKVAPNPTDLNVEEALKVYSENDCNGIIAVGGGSPIDCAKAVGARVVNPDKTVASLMGMRTKRNIPLLVAIPTTSGTGTETTMFAVITDSKTHHKQGMGDPHLMPHYAVLDPILTVGMPKHVTAMTGMDALCHAVECFTNDRYMTDDLRNDAKKAVKLIHDNIEIAFDDGGDLTARLNMQEAAFLAGRAFNRGFTGYVHAIGHTLSGLYDVPHGKAMGVILPHVMKQYGSAVFDKLSELADTCGIASGSSKKEKALAFIAWIEDINEKLGLPKGFPEIRENDIPQMVKWAKAEGNPIDPVPVIWRDADFEKCIRGIKNPSL